MGKFISGLLLSLLLAAPLAAEETEVERFGDWGKKCEQNTEGKEVCYIFQNASNKQDGTMVLRIRIGYRPGDDTPLVVMTLPLGTLLPAGAALMLEGAEPVKMPFLTCASDGCTTVGTQLPDDMVTAMKNSDKASVRVATFNKQVVALPVSLNGFAKGIDAIRP